MQFGSRSARTEWSMMILGLVPDLTVAFIITKLIDSHFLGFVITFIGLQIMYFLIWIKNLLWSWLIFYTIQRNNLSKYLFDFLVDNNFPDPGNYQESAESYLESVATDPGVPIETRLKAAAELGTMGSFIAQYKISLHTQISMAYEDAIAQYKILNKYKRYQKE